jgi:2-dehydro-3-deoxyphosphogluconate aldolase/(4S)-4-hydroxy-2-oxoglutarate aldolase
MIKVFPASSLGPDFIKAVKAPLSNIKLMPTGGIGLDNLKAYKNAGADGFGIGSPIFPTALIQSKNENNMRKHFKAFKEQWGTL